MNATSPVTEKLNWLPLANTNEQNIEINILFYRFHHDFITATMNGCFFHIISFIFVILGSLLFKVIYEHENVYLLNPIRPRQQLSHSGSLRPSLILYSEFWRVQWICYLAYNQYFYLQLFVTIFPWEKLLTCVWDKKLIDFSWTEAFEVQAKVSI